MLRIAILMLTVVGGVCAQNSKDSSFLRLELVEQFNKACDNENKHAIINNIRNIQKVYLSLPRLIVLNLYAGFSNNQNVVVLKNPELMGDKIFRLIFSPKLENEDFAEIYAAFAKSVKKADILLMKYVENNEKKFTHHGYIDRVSVILKNKTLFPKVKSKLDDLHGRAQASTYFPGMGSF